ncbi:hypothetical protein [Pseudarthrobacter raffinosi]|uniref:hypothetical protein n=1 Tax=Pseudarthrobacter raffinosi TaxID=2953651 RepID=UPI00208E0DE9|nr:MULTISPECIES: hypothetical protein [unclassified Pseudarthrobacter]MCO4251631.1 hypothetical protein [Pseudarthrobacter sp. MDT3-9]MCO4264520.1 hypothetical protein [Pseudarthrobacter sp. MDT3-26]
MRKMTKKNKILAAAGALALVAGGGGAAYAYWTTTGDGSGYAANSAGGGTVTLHAAFDRGLTPGDFRTVTYTADNADPNTSTRVGELTATVTTDKEGCLAVWFPVTAVTDDALVAAHSSGTTVGTGRLDFTDLPDTDQEACKGAIVTITVGSL